jgi:hypothetical protein
LTLTSALGPGVTAVQISVALNVPQKDSPSSILTFLSRLSCTAHTVSRVGVSNLVSQDDLDYFVLLFLCVCFIFHYQVPLSFGNKLTITF